jgi:hypothetical protein
MKQEKRSTCKWNSKFYLSNSFSVDGGELFDRIVNMGYYAEDDGKAIIRDILSAVNYLHDHNVVHRVNNFVLNLGFKAREFVAGFKG